MLGCSGLALRKNRLDGTLPSNISALAFLTYVSCRVASPRMLCVLIITAFSCSPFVFVFVFVFVLVFVHVFAFVFVFVEQRS